MQYQDNKRPIVFGCDDAYAMPLATALRSVVEANIKSWPCEFYILTNNISKYNKEKIIRSLPKGSASIEWINIDIKLFKRFEPPAHISRISYARLLIPEIFSDNVSRILYLDADILVLDDLRPLWETNLDGSVLGAVLDGIDTQVKSSRSGFKKLPRVQNYFNSGVLLIDIKYWKKLNVTERALHFLNVFPDTPFSDQDALNVACDGLWTKLDGRWNFVDYYERKKLLQLSAEALPGIVHFATDEKPWDARYLHVNARFYDSFRSRTLFARTALDKQRDVVSRTRVRLKRVLKPWLEKS